MCSPEVNIVRCSAFFTHARIVMRRNDGVYSESVLDESQEGSEHRHE